MRKAKEAYAIVVGKLQGREYFRRSAITYILNEWGVNVGVIQAAHYTVQRRPIVSMIIVEYTDQLGF
jgi:hypothetical protein